MRIVIVGGHGKVARHLHPMLVRAGHTPVALVRKEEYRDELEALGAQMCLLDVERAEVGTFAACFDGCDAVVFTAGGGPDGNIERKRTVDLEGSLKSIEAAQQVGIRRFVQVSAIDVDKPVPEHTSPVWKAYVAAKRDADAALRDSGLNWTILRPGALTSGPGAGMVSIAPELPRGEVARADVAAVIAAVLDHDGSIGHQWTVVGGDTPVEEAVRAAAG